MFKFVALAVVLSVCNSQRIVTLDGLRGLNGISGLSGISGISDGNQQYVLVPVGQKPDSIAIRQHSVVQPVARVLSAPRIYQAPQAIYHQQPQVVYQSAPKVVAQRPVVLQAPRIVSPRIEESYGPAEPYTFGFQSTDEQGNTLSRQESSDGNGAVTGSYSYTDIDGLTRVVEYIADAAGYRATVKTNEPGTANANPADVQVQADQVPSNVEQKVAQYSQYSQQQQRVRVQ